MPSIYFLDNEGDLYIEVDGGVIGFIKGRRQFYELDRACIDQHYGPIKDVSEEEAMIVLMSF